MQLHPSCRDFSRDSTIDHAIHLFCLVQPLLALQSSEFSRLILLERLQLELLFKYMVDAEFTFVQVLGQRRDGALWVSGQTMAHFFDVRPRLRNASSSTAIAFLYTASLHGTNFSFNFSLESAWRISIFDFPSE